jgi:hypothetical protein
MKRLIIHPLLFAVALCGLFLSLAEEAFGAGNMVCNRVWRALREEL